MVTNCTNYTNFRNMKALAGLRVLYFQFHIPYFLFSPGENIGVYTCL